MQTIKTKYISATNTKPSRIKATHEGNVESVTISYPYELDVAEAHVLAAQKLKDKLGWEGEMIGGSCKDGLVFVFADSSSRLV